jgi:hypothetical protein
LRCFLSLDVGTWITSVPITIVMIHVMMTVAKEHMHLLIRMIMETRTTLFAGHVNFYTLHLKRHRTQSRGLFQVGFA